MKTNPNDAINTFKGDEYTTPDGYTTSNYFNPGLTKREYIASRTFAAILATRPEGLRPQDLKQCAEDAVLLADALIEALNKGKEDAP